jgi:hypothetical protein
MPNTKPLVSVACVCEKILQEKDGVLSAIRLVDTIYIERMVEALPENLKPGFQIAALVSLKSGDIIGEQEVRVVLRKPSGEVNDIGKWKVVLQGGEHGANFALNFMLSGTEFGLFWFDVIWQGEVLTSMPLKVAQRTPEPERH